MELGGSYSAIDDWSLSDSGCGQRGWRRFLEGRHGRRLGRVLGCDGAGADALLHECLNPRLVYRTIPVRTVRDEAVTMGEGVAFESARLSSVLAGCRHVVCFIATIGHFVDHEIRRLSTMNRYAEAYLLDRIGSAAVEETVQAFHRDLALKYQRRGQCVTMRFSPGYCDWPIEGQRALFSLVDATTVGVSLSPACLMSPRKSITGVIGVIGGNGSWRRRVVNPCDRCDRCDCVEKRPLPSFLLYREQGERLAAKGRTETKEVTIREN